MTTENANAVDPTGATDTQSTQPDAQANVDVESPQFAQLVDAGNSNANPNIGRFRDICVKVTAEIGNVMMPIGEILNLGEGSVIELDKPTSAPIDLMAQGVRIARGEVVVVDDCFAIRIKQIEAPQELT